MLADKMNSVIKGVFGGAGLVAVGALVLALMVLAPFLAVWVVNSLAEAGGAAFRLEHTAWTYFLAFVALVLVRGGK